MRRILPLAAALVLVAAAPAGSTVGSGLRGIVKTPRPVCLQDDPCSGGAAGLELVFSRNGSVVKRVTSGEAGRYRVVLRPGTYTVTSPAALQAPKGGVAPSSVRVVEGRFRFVNFFVDTGVRAP